MKTKRIARSIAMAAYILAAGHVHAQTSVLGNNPTTPGTDYVGWDVNTTVPLMVRHDNNQPIQWYTDALQRMQLYQTRTGVLPLLSGGSVNVQQNGYLGLSGTPGFFAVNGYGPFSRLHLADLDPGQEGQNHYNQPWGYRTWMRNGITLTGNHDHAYIGQRYYDHDETDLVIHWSDNADKSEFGPDRLRFLFTSDNTNATSGARSVEGLEFMRMFPVNATEGFVGVGDYAQPSLAEPEPTERLDLLNRTIRLRDFADPLLYRNDTYDRVLVADPSDGTVYWRLASTLPSSSGTDCDWLIANNGVSGPTVSHNVYTAVGTSDLCPDATDLVGIGITDPLAKLHVLRTVNSGSDNRGSQFEINGSTSNKIAGHFVASGGGGVHLGVRSFAINGSSLNHALLGWGLVDAGGSTNTNTGLSALAQVSNNSTVSYNVGVDASTSTQIGTTITSNYGVRATAYSYATGSLNYGGYFDAWAPYTATNWALYTTGASFTPGGNWSPSDASLKTQVEDADAAVESNILDEIRLHRYMYDPNACPQIQFPEGSQLGVLAHELEEVFPELVRPVIQPERLDEEGNVVYPSVEFKAVNYGALIPHLIAGYQSSRQHTVDLEATITAQNERLDQLESMLLDCCNRNSSPDGDRSLQQEQGSLNERLNERAMQVVPNPFQTETTIHYILERGGRVQLMANSADGKQLRVLQEITSEAGVYQFNWNTADLAAGMYYVTLLLDGEAITKRAVKIDR